MVCLLLQASGELLRRRAANPMPASPVPNSAIVRGSGVVVMLGAQEICVPVRVWYEPGCEMFPMYCCRVFMHCVGL